MAVVAEFEADKTTGLVPPSEVVTFTDLSTGSPDRWYWDFGDGLYSYEQHPTHTYYGEAGEGYSVTLKAWISDSEIVAGGGSLNNQTKLRGPIEGNAACFAAFQGASYGSNSQDCSIYINKNYGSGDPRYYAYLGGRHLWTNKILATMVATDVFYQINAKLTQSSDIGAAWDIDTQGGSIQIQVDAAKVAEVSGVGAYDIWVPYHDISYKAGAGNFDWNHQPLEVILPDAGDTLIQGLQVYAEIVKYKATSVDNIDDEEKINYLMFGLPPVANFGGSPTLVSNGGIVNFINTSTPATGLPTTYSWKRRKTGSGDSFVEFSDLENPSIGFGK